MKINKKEKKYKKYKKLLKEFYKLHRLMYTKKMTFEIQSEYRKLHNKLFDSGKYEEFNIHLDKTFPKYKDRTKVKNKINKFKNGDIEDIYNEKIPQEYYW